MLSSDREMKRLVSRTISKAQNTAYLNHQIHILFLNWVYEPEHLTIADSIKYKIR